MFPKWYRREYACPNFTLYMGIKLPKKEKIPDYHIDAP